ncbi:MAG TPA: TIGR03084 family metal-binding protein [Streptosporangiaceae bacterium]
MPADLAPLLDDLAAESAALQALLGPLAPGDWRRPTPAAGWTVTDQVTHLAYFDDVTLLSITDPDRFRRDAEALAAGGDDYPDRVAAAHRHLDGDTVATWFRAARQGLLDGYARCDPATRLPWFGPDMGVASSVTARLMETWAHGQDIADTLGLDRPPTQRLRHLAHIGIRALPYSYRVNGLPRPDQPIRVELTAPDGDVWTWGPEGATNRVAGAALDFCLAVTQRRHLADTRLVVTGPVASQWMTIAQAFAGPAGPGRPPASGGPR